MSTDNNTVTRKLSQDIVFDRMFDRERKSSTFREIERAAYLFAADFGTVEPRNEMDVSNYRHYSFLSHEDQYSRFTMPHNQTILKEDQDDSLSMGSINSDQRPRPESVSDSSPPPVFGSKFRKDSLFNMQDLKSGPNFRKAGCCVMGRRG